MKNITLILFAMVTVTLFGQNNDGDLAKIGKNSITVKEFIKRYELTPKFTSSVAGIADALKKEFLYSLIAEKLMATEAEALGLDTSAANKEALTYFKELFLRDALFEKEINSKSEPTMQDLLADLSKSLVKLTVKKITVGKKEQIDNIYQLLEKGMKFDSLFVEYDKERKGINTIEVEYGMFRKEFEDTLYALKVGGYTKPIQLSKMWNIFYVADRRDSTLKSTKEYENELTRVKQLYKQRELDTRADKYCKDFFINKKVESNGALLRLLADRINEYAIIQKNFTSKDTTGKLLITSPGMEALQKSFSKDTLQLTYITLEKKPILFKEYLHYINTEPLVLNGTDLNSIAGSIHANTKHFIEYKLLAEQAGKQNLESDSSMIASFTEWKDYVLAHSYQNLFADSMKVSDDEVTKYYNKRYGKNNSLDKINIREIVSDNLDAIGGALEELSKGKPFEEITAKYSKVEATKNKGGETGFVPATEYGEAGEKALAMKKGEIFGPIKTHKGFVLFQLLDIQKGKIDDTTEYVAVKEGIKRNLGFAKYQRSLENATARLALKYNLQVDSVLLSKTKVTDLNGVYYRFIGFGGRLLATPLTMPFNDWIDAWKKEKQLNP